MARPFGFYHLTRSPLDDALIKLLIKASAGGLRAVVRSPQVERVEQLDRSLWTKGKESFLPHGTMSDPHPERQPIYLTTGTEVPNAAGVLILLDDAPADGALDFERALELFDGRDQEAVASARRRWRWAKAAGFEPVYWREDERGSWRRAGPSDGA